MMGKDFFLLSKTLHHVAVGDTAKIKDALAEYGTLEVFNTEDKKINATPDVK